MNDAQRPTMAAGLVSGRLEGIRIPDLLWALCRSSETGVLTVSRGSIRKTLYFEEGRIVFAASTDPEDRLGEMFLRQGRIRLDQLEHALSQLHTGKRIGTLLVESGHLTAEALVNGVLEQVEAVVLDTFTWQVGEYRFDEGPLPTDEVITLRMKTSQLLLQGIRRIRSFGAIRTSVGPPRTTFDLAEGWREIVDGLELNEGDELLIGKLDRGAETVENLCREVFLSNFEIYQTLWGFKVLGVINEVEAGIRKSAEASQEGSLREQDLAGLLVGLAQEQATGVLHIHGRSTERTFHIDRGRCVFATSSDIDDGLVSYLLQRGVISLRDREETARRLLSNKRVGTILRELGVIDDQDLGDMVRQQLSNIVFDTFRWEQGDFAFVPGSLPSIEEITLDVTIEALVAEGLRRVTSWSRVREGCGDLGYGLELTPSFLDVLDAMSAGSQEWQVVTLLKSPRTPKQICREADLSDFRVCQILWTLRVLGAAVPAEIDVAQPVAVDTSEAEPDEPVHIDVEEVEEQPVAVLREESPELLSVETSDESQPVGDGDGEPLDVQQVEIDREPEQDWSLEQSFDLDERVAADESESLDPSPADRSFEPTVAAEAARDDDEPIDSPDEADAAASAEATQAISRELIEQALSADREPPVEEPIIEEPTVEEPTMDEPVLTDAAGGNGESWSESDEIDEASATQKLSREEVERALARPSAAVEPLDDSATAEMPFPEIVESVTDEDASDFEPPDDLERAIARFNAMQRLVFRAIRSEVGAGASNVIRACFEQAEDDEADPLQSAELLADGSWDAEGLRRAVVAHRIQDPWIEYQRLIELELELLRSHIGEAKLLDLQRQIEKLDRPGAG